MARTVLLFALMLLTWRDVTGQAPSPANLQQQPPPVERLSETLLRIGTVLTDMKRREVTVTGAVNDVNVLEFVANTKGGFKAYESALTLDTDAITFNLALVLIGLDRSRAVPPERHFDPRTPEGDPVEIFVEWKVDGNAHRIRAEELLYSRLTKTTFPKTHWVYTGSVFYQRGYAAANDGVLIGFVHSPSPIIENPLSIGVGNYGSIVVNPTLNLNPGTSITLTVRALDRKN